MSDRFVAWLRTAVPVVWSAAVAWLILHIPALQPLADQLGRVGDLVLVPLVLAGYKAAANVVEQHLPPWLRTVLLGSTLMPVYPRGVMKMNARETKRMLDEFHAALRRRGQPVRVVGEHGPEIDIPPGQPPAE